MTVQSPPEARRATPSYPYDRSRDLALYVSSPVEAFNTRELRRLLALEQARLIASALKLEEMTGEKLLDLARNVEKYLEDGRLP